MTQKNNSFTTYSSQKLSIQISLSGLSFCTLQKETNTITTIKDYVFDSKLNPFEVYNYLKRLFETETFLKHTFDDILIIHENDLSTLVPQSLFNEDYLADYLKFNSKILKSDFIAFDNIKSNSSVNVYVPYVNINNFIYEKFGAFTFKHYSTILIETILKAEASSIEDKMYLNVESNHFELIVISKGNLLLYNTFEYANAEDFIYYILFAVEQLALDTETLETILLGKIEKGDTLYNIAYKYIRHIKFGHRGDTYNYTDKTKTSHSYFTLIHSF